MLSGRLRFGESGRRSLDSAGLRAKPRSRATRPDAILLRRLERSPRRKDECETIPGLHRRRRRRGRRRRGGRRRHELRRRRQPPARARGPTAGRPAVRASLHRRRTRTSRGRTPTPTADDDSGRRRSPTSRAKRAEDPDDVAVLLDLGDAYFMAPAPAAGRARVRAGARTRSPDNATAQVGLAMVWHAEGDSKRAETALRRVLEGAPGRPGGALLPGDRLLLRRPRRRGQGGVGDGGAHRPHHRPPAGARRASSTCSRTRSRRRPPPGELTATPRARPSTSRTCASAKRLNSSASWPGAS